MQRNAVGKISKTAADDPNGASDDAPAREKCAALPGRDFFETVRERAERSPDYRIVLLCEALETLLEGDHVTAQLLLRDYVNATLGFESLGRRIGKSPKSLMRMLSAEGNPRADNLLAILKALQDHEGITFRIEAVRAA